jgi:hypothetical protein
MTQQRLPVENFIQQAQQIHGNKYDYSRVVYQNNCVPVIIGCPTHGNFIQKPSAHSKGCPNCANRSN